MFGRYLDTGAHFRWRFEAIDGSSHVVSVTTSRTPRAQTKCLGRKRFAGGRALSGQRVLIASDAFISVRFGGIWSFIPTVRSLVCTSEMFLVAGSTGMATIAL